MDEFDFKEEQPKRSFSFGAALFNCASIILLVGALVAAGFYALIFFDPQTGLNPFPPAAATATQALTSTATFAELTETTVPTQTSTLEPTAIPTPELVLSYELQPGDNPASTDASTFHPDLACNFMGVAGQVFQGDTPVAGLQVHITGTLAGQEVDKMAVTGAATQFGPGQYYEIQLADQPIASEGTLQISIQGAEGQPFSAPVSFNTTDSCQDNLILVNFSALEENQEGL